MSITQHSKIQKHFSTEFLLVSFGHDCLHWSLHLNEYMILVIMRISMIQSSLQMPFQSSNFDSSFLQFLGF